MSLLFQRERMNIRFLFPYRFTLIIGHALTNKRILILIIIPVFYEYSFTSRTQMSIALGLNARGLHNNT